MSNGREGNFTLNSLKIKKGREKANSHDLFYLEIRGDLYFTTPENEASSQTEYPGSGVNIRNVVLLETRIPCDERQVLQLHLRYLNAIKRILMD